MQQLIGLLPFAETPTRVNCCLLIIYPLGEVRKGVR